MNLEQLLINTKVSTNRTVIVLREELIKALSEIKAVTTPNPDEITITWCTDDVVMLAEQKGYAVPTLEQAREVLSLAKQNHDASVGISWDVLEVYLDAVIQNKY